MKAVIVFACLLLVTFVAASGGSDDKRPCKTKPSDLRVCGALETPVLNASTNCPSCRPRLCTESVVEACMRNLRDCNATEVPVALGCCPSCKPVPARCSDSQVDACKRNYAALPVCASNQTPAFNKTTCCYNCRPPVNDDDKPKNGRCNNTQFQTCVTNAPVCEDGEVPNKNISDGCCNTCIRPARLCSKEDIAACRDSTPVCNGTDLPAIVSGSCCLTCRLAEPVCNPACATNLTCVYPRPFENGTVLAPVCRPFRVAVIRFRVVQAALLLANMTCEQRTDYIKEVVNRFCDKNENTGNCSRFRDTFLNIKNTLLGTACRNNNTVEVVVPNPPPASSVPTATVHLMSFSLEDTDPSDPTPFLTAAFSDSDATGGDQITFEAATSSNTSPAAAFFSFSMAIASICLSVIALFQN